MVETLEQATLDADEHKALEVYCPKCGTFPVRLSTRASPAEGARKERVHIGKRLNRAMAIAQLLVQQPTLTSTELAIRAGGSRNDTLRLIAQMRGRYCKTCGSTQEPDAEGRCVACVALMNEVMQKNAALDKEPNEEVSYESDDSNAE